MKVIIVAQNEATGKWEADAAGQVTGAEAVAALGQAVSDIGAKMYEAEQAQAAQIQAAMEKAQAASDAPQVAPEFPPPPIADLVLTDTPQKTYQAKPVKRKPVKRMANGKDFHIEESADGKVANIVPAE